MTDGRTRRRRKRAHDGAEKCWSCHAAWAPNEAALGSVPRPRCRAELDGGVPPGKLRPWSLRRRVASHGRLFPIPSISRSGLGTSQGGVIKTSEMCTNAFHASRRKCSITAPIHKCWCKELRSDSLQFKESRNLNIFKPQRTVNSNTPSPIERDWLLESAGARDSSKSASPTFRH